MRICDQWWKIILQEVSRKANLGSATTLVILDQWSVTGGILIFPHLSTCKFFNRLEWLRWKILFHMTFTLILKTSSRLPLSLKCFLNLFLQDTRIYLRPYGWLLLCNVFWVLSVPADAFQDWLQYELYFSQEIKPVFFSTSWVCPSCSWGQKIFQKLLKVIFTEVQHHSYWKTVKAESWQDAKKCRWVTNMEYSSVTRTQHAKFNRNQRPH